MGAVSSRLTLVLVGEPGQGGREIEGRLRQDHLEQEADGTQTEGQHGQWGPGRAGRERADLSLRARGGPPLSPLGPPQAGRWG